MTNEQALISEAHKLANQKVMGMHRTEEMYAEYFLAEVDALRAANWQPEDARTRMAREMMKIMRPDEDSANYRMGDIICVDIGDVSRLVDAGVHFDPKVTDEMRRVFGALGITERERSLLAPLFKEPDQ